MKQACIFNQQKTAGTWLKCMLLVGFCLLGLSACVLQTHQRVLDTAIEYDGIVELPQVVYKLGDRYFVQGVQTTLRRSERQLMTIPMVGGLGAPPPGKSGVYTILPDAPRKTVYLEFCLKDKKKPMEVDNYAYCPMGHSSTPPDEDANVWPAGSYFEQKGWHPYRNKKGEVTAWFQYVVEVSSNREYKGVWMDKLPAGARPILLSREQLAQHPVLKGEAGVAYYDVWNCSEARVDQWRALYAYPLAAVCWMVPDAAVTAASHVAALPLFIWILGYDLSTPSQ